MRIKKKIDVNFGDNWLIQFKFSELTLLELYDKQKGELLMRSCKLKG